jgi:choline dehydrogenase-like flavoprotein
MSINNFIDANEYDFPTKIKTSVCIIGGGAAGITLARNLKTIDDVLIIESGNFNMEGSTQALYKGENTSLPYHDLLSCRLRYFGGTTNHWGGYCRPNDPIDYEGRESLGLPKWPINEVTLSPYIAKAAKELGLKSEFFNNESILGNYDIPHTELIDREINELYTKVFQLTRKKRFAKTYKDELSEQANLQVCMNLNVIHIQLDPKGNKVVSILCKTLKGKEVIIEANNYILASHAIENARLLLNSNNVNKQGIGNDFDHVGRYFMDHIHIQATKLIPSDNFPFIYDRNVLRDMKLNANISFTDNYLRKNNILQYYCRFIPIYTQAQVRDSITGIKGEINKPFSNKLYEDIKVVLNDFGGTKNQLLSNFRLTQPVPKYYYLDQRIEQAPNPNSRVVLSNDKDALGIPLANLEWNLNEHDYRTFEIGQEKIIKELSALGAGRFIIEKITPELVNERVAGHYHHIGTTRMSNNAEEGVVDANCKVHGIDNLYVAGSSVFPTAGYSGPTMMIVALSIRLAEHIKINVGSYDVS